MIFDFESQTDFGFLYCHADLVYFNELLSFYGPLGLCLGTDVVATLQVAKLQQHLFFT